MPTYLFTGSVSCRHHRRAGPGGHRAPAASTTCTRCTARSRSPAARTTWSRGHGLHPPAGLRQRRRVADRHRGGIGRRGRLPAAGGTQRAPGARDRGLHPRRCWWRASPGWRTPPTRRRGAAAIPTVLAQEAQAVFGHTVVGQVLFVVVQVATALILYTGGNTSFNGFPFLASYVAGDAFLPRWLLKRGHRLVFSNGIILLTIISIALLIIRRPNVNEPRAAVRDRRLHRLHHGGLRHGAVPPAPQGPAGGAGWSSSTSRRACSPSIVVGDLRGREVHRGRLARGGALRHPGAGADPAEP